MINVFLRIIKFLSVSILFFSCNSKIIEQNNITVVRILEDDFLEMATPKMLIDSLKKYPQDIFIIKRVSLNFCRQEFKDELTNYNDDRSLCSEIRSGDEGLRLTYRKTDVAKEVDWLLERIRNECKFD